MVEGEQMKPVFYCHDIEEYKWILNQIENDKWPVPHNGGWIDKATAMKMADDYNICIDCPCHEKCECIDH